MRKCFEQLEPLIKAHAPIIWVNTYEENAFIRDLCELAYDSGYALNEWSVEENINEYDTMAKCVRVVNKANFKDLCNRIATRQSCDDPLKMKEMYIIKDAHMIMSNNLIKRTLRERCERPEKTYVPIIFISPIIDIPVEFEKIISVFHYDLPSTEEVASMVNGICKVYEEKNKKTPNTYKIPDEQDRKVIVNSLLGLTHNEIKFILSKSSIQYSALNIDAISENKVKLVEKSGLLDYVIPKVSFEDIGGNRAFKQWINDIEVTFSEDAKAFGCESPKGYLSLGIAGTGKTIIAEAIANKWGYPLFIFNVSKIFDRLVGESEKRIEQALRIVKSCAPCVLLFDEAEKIFGGYGGSESDGGTSSRVFSSILRFMAENDNIFIVMTSNDISKLPPELMRSGRLDTMWYFGFPNGEERKEIFKIHFAKTNHTVDDDTLDLAVEHTDKYTGAEIKNIVKQTIWETFKKYKETGNNNITIDNINYAISKVIPISKTSREQISALEMYSKNRALFANGDNVDSKIVADINNLIDNIDFDL